MEQPSPGELLQAAEAKLAHFQHLYSQYTAGTSADASEPPDPSASSGGLPNVTSWRDLPTPGSTPARPDSALHQQQQQQHAGIPPVAQRRLSSAAPEGEPRFYPHAGVPLMHGGGRMHATTTAWPEGISSMSGSVNQHLGGSVRSDASGATSDLLLQYRVASATAEQLPSKVLVLQQQLAVQVSF